MFPTNFGPKYLACFRCERKFLTKYTRTCTQTRVLNARTDARTHVYPEVSNTFLVAFDCFRPCLWSFPLSHHVFIHHNLWKILNSPYLSQQLKTLPAEVTSAVFCLFIIIQGQFRNPHSLLVIFYKQPSWKLCRSARIVNLKSTTTNI